MDLLNGLTDDQFALLGCAAALAVCGGLMSLSVLVGPRRESQSVAEGIRHKAGQPAAPVVAHQESQRRAA